MQNNETKNEALIGESDSTDGLGFALHDLPPEGSALRKLGMRLAELLDEDQWEECEQMLFTVADESHEKIKILSDAMYSRGIISYEIMCEMLVIALSEQNDMYFKYAVEAESSIPKTLFRIDDAMNKLIEAIERYGFACEGGNLATCAEWVKLKGEIAAIRAPYIQRIAELETRLSGQTCFVPPEFQERMDELERSENACLVKIDELEAELAEALRIMDNMAYALKNNGAWIGDYEHIDAAIAAHAEWKNKANAPL